MVATVKIHRIALYGESGVRDTISQMAPLPQSLSREGTCAAGPMEFETITTTSFYDALSQFGSCFMDAISN